MIGNLYAVGTYDLAVFLITSNDGHILINTGVEDSTAMIRQNIESVGFRLEDVKILLATQAHWDHTAALAEIKDLTCLLYTSPSPRDRSVSRMPSSA